MDIQQLPTDFLESCTDQERCEVTTWWKSLKEPTQTELSVLLDQRRDARAYVFAPNEDDEFEWRILPIENHHLESEDDPRDFERERYNEWLQHVLDHKELTNNWDDCDFQVRSFHMCTEHALAKSTRTMGTIEGDFVCPNGSTCPIQTFAQTFDYAILLSSAPKSEITTWLCLTKSPAKTPC